MDSVNETLAEEITKVPPENPMYAGGIAVLVAFVLFMYWGSLHEKDDEKDELGGRPPKEIPHWFQKKEKPPRKIKKKKKKPKKNRSGMYSVSDAMAKNLLLETNQGQPKSDESCAECEQCRCRDFEIESQNQRAFRLHATQFVSNKSTQTHANKTTECMPDSERDRGDRTGEKNARTTHAQPQRQRSYSSPDPMTTTPTNCNACTCTYAQLLQNGGRRDLLYQHNLALLDGYKVGASVMFCQGDVRTPVLPSRVPGEGKRLHSERQTQTSSHELGRSCVNASGGRHPRDGVRINGKVQRQLDDAYVRLEGRPDVTIAIVAETIM